MTTVVLYSVSLTSIVAIALEADRPISQWFTFSVLIGIPFEKAESIAAITLAVIYLKDTPNRIMRQRNELSSLMSTSASQLFRNSQAFVELSERHSAEGIALDFFDLSNVKNLEGINLSNTKIRGADFTGVNLSRAQFRSANLWNSYFKHSLFSRSRSNPGGSFW
ncbi:MAG: pentapeptide repeat-containing protein [Phormidesmis sp.]